MGNFAYKAVVSGYRYNVMLCIEVLDMCASLR